jgi:competence protein ComEA
VKKWWKDYFTFSKTERIGLFVLLGLIGLIWILPKYFQKSPIKYSFENEKGSGLDSLINLKDANKQYNEVIHLQKHKLFFFDPNTINDSAWASLGLQPKTIATINHYKEKGGQFRLPEDIKKIYGIKPSLVEELLPYVRIPVSNKEGLKNDERFPRSTKYQGFKDTNYAKVRANFINKKFVKVDINTADTLAFIAMPGIGPTLAHRIVKFRENLGGFISVEQLLEVYGIKDSVFQILKPQLFCSNGVQPIAINVADFNVINRHPYISYQEAKAIVKYREQHGKFMDSSDLLKLAIVDASWLQKISPYLSFDTTVIQ